VCHDMLIFVLYRIYYMYRLRLIQCVMSVDDQRITNVMIEMNVDIYHHTVSCASAIISASIADTVIVKRQLIIYN